MFIALNKSSCIHSMLNLISANSSTVLCFKAPNPGVCQKMIYYPHVVWAKSSLSQLLISVALISPSTSSEQSPNYATQDQKATVDLDRNRLVKPAFVFHLQSLFPLCMQAKLQCHRGTTSGAQTEFIMSHTK